MNLAESTAFAARLARLGQEDRRADRAVVKRARTKHPDQRVLARRVYHGLIPDGVAHTAWNMDVVERVAGMFVVNPVCVSDGSGFGMTVRRLALRTGVSADAVERRFVALLGAGIDTFDDHMARLLARCHAEGVGVDYGRLAFDVARVGHPERFVQRGWADQFWGSHATDDNNGTGEQTS